LAIIMAQVKLARRMRQVKVCFTNLIPYSWVEIFAIWAIWYIFNIALKNTLHLVYEWCKISIYCMHFPCRNMRCCTPPRRIIVCTLLLHLEILKCCNSF
jgi:hypothetical protein